MIVITTQTVRPHSGKARLQLNNMKDVVKAFGDIGITSRIFLVLLEPNAGCLVFSNFATNFAEAMTYIQELFSSEIWTKVKIRLDDNPASYIVIPLNIIRVANC